MIYAYVNMKTMNPEKLAQYREHAGAALAKHGGTLVATGKENEVLEGEIDAPAMAAVLSFPDKDSAHAWINDAELKHVHEMRRNAGDVSIVLIG